MSAPVPASPPPGALEITAIAEVEITSTGRGRKLTKLIPAERVASGDRVIYSLEVRNVGAATVPAPAITYAIPAHMSYLADSAVGPGAQVSYSIDGGSSFDRPDNLKVTADGAPRTATADQYTHIRWQLKNSLKAHSIAFVRFRAVAK